MPLSSGFKYVSTGTGSVARKMILRSTGGSREINGAVHSSETTVSAYNTAQRHDLDAPPHVLHNSTFPTVNVESPLLLRSTFSHHAWISKIRRSRSILSTLACLIS
jgi:hypothetical protein